jgi:hypothetical protein
MGLQLHALKEFRRRLGIKGESLQRLGQKRSTETFSFMLLSELLSLVAGSNKAWPTIAKHGRLLLVVAIRPWHVTNHEWSQLC